MQKASEHENVQVDGWHRFHEIKHQALVFAPRDAFLNCQIVHVGGRPSYLSARLSDGLLSVGN
jgi:hypothetical protein